MTTENLREEIDNAMGEALGCGGHIDKDMLEQIERRLAPLWRTLPKNVQGNVERRSLRYVVHRYFNRRWAIHIRGFEPSRALNATHWGVHDILGQRVPGYVESVLESQHKLVQGFTLSDAAHMVATIEQLIFDWEGRYLEQIYEDMGARVSRPLSYHGLARLLETYVVSWLLRTDTESARALILNTTRLIDTVPHWIALSLHIRGKIRALQYRRGVIPVVSVQDGSARAGQNALMAWYSFEDAHRVVGDITKSFASYWESECTSMKLALYDMDKRRTGRVPLSRFHGRGLEADWRFGESEVYLRELGALDETGSQGKQVMIANYMQAASNCVVSTPHYLLCCVNECEPILEEIEELIGSPTAGASRILKVVQSVNAQSTVDDDFPPPLREGDVLHRQLEQIAAVNSGEVPLHGRLFAQWLHYAFPRECAFPHKMGAVSMLTPAEYGESFYASPEEMERHASQANATVLATASASKEEMQWMSQWSSEEELIAEHVTGLQAPWEQSTMLLNATTVLGLGALIPALLLVAGGMFGKGKDNGHFGIPSWQKSHFV